MAGEYVRNDPGALGELRYNHQESAPRSTSRFREEHPDRMQADARSPTKSTLGRLGFRHYGERERLVKAEDVSPKKPKKAKSGTNLAGLLTRPKSLKNLYKMASEEESRARDKENRNPDVTPAAVERPPPIFAQFTSDKSVRQQVNDLEESLARAAKARPVSFQASRSSDRPPQPPSPAKSQGCSARPMSLHPDQATRSKFLSGVGQHKFTPPASSPTSDVNETRLDAEEIDRQLEALLDRRNIPENQRYKMRNLTDTIKLEFIRQDHAEMQAAKMDHLEARGSVAVAERTSNGANSSDVDEEQPKRGRGRSFTFSRGKKDSSSPNKKSKGEGTLGRHFRSRSTDSVASSETRLISAGHSVGTSILSKLKAQQGPSEYVAYLRKVQQPSLVEVGKLHKLRLLLRNETVAWIEEFMQLGGMQEIVGLLHRIMEVEWREEHEDALLHENLLCLKGLSTTARAMEFLHSVQCDLIPKLLHLLFDPERKGPSEFTTRNIITSVLLTYIESAPPVERMIRAKNVLGHLRDPEGKEEDRPVPFVLEMRQSRPYQVWCKEAVSVTKEVFWIFLHNLNVIALPNDKAPQPGSQRSLSGEDQGPFGYMLRNFPQERPPVPAAPYVGGVEWDATNYLASHLDLMNAILACTSTSRERNTLRAEFRISGWEKCLGGSLRICKEKFYGSVHVALRTWVAAAAEDGWDVRDVRFGPAPDPRSPKKAAAAQKPKVEAPPPKLEMPKLALTCEKQVGAKDAWL